MKKNALIDSFLISNIDTVHFQLVLVCNRIYRASVKKRLFELISNHMKDISYKRGERVRKIHRSG